MTALSMFRHGLVAAMALGFAACAHPDGNVGNDPRTQSTATLVTWTDGKPAYDLTCGNPGGCQRRATAICKGGSYAVLKSENMPVSAGIEVYTLGKASATIRCS